MIRIVSLASLVAIALAATAARSAPAIVTDGVAKAVVVIPDQPSKVVQYAAEELVYHVAKASGARLEVVPESRSPAAATARIVLGPTKAAAQAGIDVERLAPDTFVLRVQGSSLFIVGGDSDGEPLVSTTWAGTLFGVYQWLEETLGVRWLWPGTLGEHVPKTASITLSPVDKTVAPRLIIRNLRSTLDRQVSPDGFSAEASAQARRDELRWLRRQRMGRSRSMRWGHSFTSYWDRFGQQHPDWFNLLENGRREPQSRNSALVSMCVSNPQLHQQIVADWLRACAASPRNKPNINGCENDVFGRCQCANCKAWDAPRSDEKDYPSRFSDHGIVSDRYARFWRSLQELAAKHDPDAIVTGYAYVNYAPPPVKEKLNAQVWIGMVPDAFYPRSADEQRQCLAMWDGWARTGCKLFLRPNYTLDGYCMPYIYVHQFADEFAHCAKNGMIATDFDSLTAMWATQGPQAYLFARWPSCLDRPVDDVLAEYYAGFGPASAAVKKYFDYWERFTTGHRQALLDEAKTTRSGWSTFPRYAHLFEAGFEPARALLAEARQAAAADSTAAARVEFLALGLTHAEKSVAAAQARQSGDIVAAQKALQDLRAFRRQIERQNVANLSYCVRLEQRAFGLAEQRNVLYAGDALQPLAAEVAQRTLQPIPVRGSFGCLAILKAGERFRAAIATRMIGRRDDETSWALYSAKLDLIAKGLVGPKKQAELDVPVSAPGVYNLVVRSGLNVADLTVRNDHAVLMGQNLALLGRSGPLYFFVPKGTKRFQIKLSSTPPGETAQIVVMGPTGRLAATTCTGPKPEVTVDVKVAAGEEGRTWSIVPGKGPTGVWEDYTIHLDKALPPYWAWAPDRLLVPAGP